MHSKKFIFNDPMKIKEEMNNIMYFVDIKWSETPQWVVGNTAVVARKGWPKERTWRKRKKKRVTREERLERRGNGWWCV